METSENLQEIDVLADKIAELVYNWGFKRVHGRIWTHLFLASQALDAAELVRRLKISKALVSISLRELLDFHLIVEVGKSVKSTHLYRTNSDLVHVFLNILKHREKSLVDSVKSAQAVVESLQPQALDKSSISPARVADLRKIIETLDGSLDTVINLQGDNDQVRKWQGILGSSSSSSSEGGRGFSAAPN